MAVLEELQRDEEVLLADVGQLVQTTIWTKSDNSNKWVWTCSYAAPA
jgi:hypothetical protein